MSDLNDKTKIPIAWAATIILSVIGMAFNAGVAHYRLGTVEGKVVEIEKASVTRELKIQKLEITLSNIEKTVESIDRKLDRMRRMEDERNGN
jgi:hypothetical protein